MIRRRILTEVAAISVLGCVLSCQPAPQAARFDKPAATRPAASQPAGDVVVRQTQIAPDAAGVPSLQAGRVYVLALGRFSLECLDDDSALLVGPDGGRVNLITPEQRLFSGLLRAGEEARPSDLSRTEESFVRQFIFETTVTRSALSDLPRIVATQLQSTTADIQHKALLELANRLLAVPAPQFLGRSVSYGAVAVRLELTDRGRALLRQALAARPAAGTRRATTAPSTEPAESGAPRGYAGDR